MIHFHRWSVWSLPVRVGVTFAEQYRCCTKCGKSESRTIDCAGSLKEVHDALRSVAKNPSDKDHATDLPTTREITRSILRSQIWQKLYGNVGPELTATEINLHNEVRELKQKLDSAEAAFTLATSNTAALSTEAYGLRNKLKACEQQRDAAYEERNHLVEKLVAADKRIATLNAALTGRPKGPFSHPGATIRPEVCSHCSTLMEPKLVVIKDFSCLVWFCPTCQK